MRMLVHCSPLSRLSRLSRLFCLLRALAPAVLAAAPLEAQHPLPGYSPDAAAREQVLEKDAIARPAPVSASAHSRALSREVHIAGTPAQEHTRDYVLTAMRSWGLATETRMYEVYLPHTTQLQAWRVAPDTLSLKLAEGPVAADSTSLTETEPVIANGTSGEGDVSAPVVYVNYGLIEDYAQLDSAGVSVAGKIAVARYGRSFRGIKAREAEKRGAVALIIYSDPQEDGFVHGDVYPEGPMRPPQGVQRGSVFNGDGDPSTPGYPSRPGAPRIPVAQMTIPHIPVLPMSYANASELLRGLRGAAIPAPSWQGGLPFRYHIGPGPIAARVVVHSDASTHPYKKIWDTFGIIRGSELPDQVVIIGGHRDAWGPGAGDNVSGTVSVLEVARAMAEMVKAGMRPKRTLVFATWDAEEWGLVGSSEYIEDDSLRLGRGAVAYFNLDVSAMGPHFGGGGAPSMRALLRDAASQVPDPSGAGSVYAVWRKESAVPDSVEPPMGDPGGGSDFAGFYNHLGIPIAEWGFGGASGVYHSFYDSYHWMRSFGDPTFGYHAAAARIGAAMMLRMANAEILPYDYVEYARTMRAYLAPLGHAMAKRQWDSSTTVLSAALDRFDQQAHAFATVRDSALARGTPGRAVRDATNGALLQVERALIRSQGLRTRSWYRNLIYVADEDNGYATMVFPSVNEAVRSGDRALAAAELADLAAHFDQAATMLGNATHALNGGR